MVARFSAYGLCVIDRRNGRHAFSFVSKRQSLDHVEVILAKYQAHLIRYELCCKVVPVGQRLRAHLISSHRPSYEQGPGLTSILSDQIDPGPRTIVQFHPGTWRSYSMHVAAKKPNSGAVCGWVPNNLELPHHRTGPLL